MSTPPFEVADIIRLHGESFIEKNRSWLSWLHVRVLLAIERCRTAALGGHKDRCCLCGHETTSFNSCRSRHCPKCQTNARNRWLTARGKELLPVAYVHVVFTLPHELSWLTLHNKKVVYDLLFRASAATLLEIAADPKHLGAEIGFLSVLHTWGQTLQHHPHLPCVMPAGGLSPDHQRWIYPRYPFFPAGESLEPRVSRQVCRRFESRLSATKVAVSWFLKIAGTGQSLPVFSAVALPQRLGRLCQTALRGTYACPAVSGALHPSGRYL
jgi:hypothetical protein